MREKTLHWGMISTHRQEIMGIACLWVIFHHNTFDWPAALWLVRKLATYGNAGVDIFLFLSGISLYFAYQKKPKLRTFYQRRIVRLIVPYLLLAVPYWIWRDLYLQKGNFLLDVTMLSFPLEGVITTWYVGAILVFYLAFPLIYKLYYETDQICGVPVSRKTTMILVPAFMAAVCFGMMYLCPELYDHIEIGLTRSVIFLIGCAAGQRVYRKEPMGSEWLWISGVFLGFYLLVFRTTVRLPDYWIRMTYAPTAVSLVLLLTWILSSVSWKPLKRVLVYFGDRSLELYLAHVLLKNVYLQYIPTPVLDRWGVLDYTIVVAVSMVIGEAVHQLSKKISGAILR